MVSSTAYKDADHDLDDEVALDVDAQAQVQTLADGLLEARGGGELVVLLRGGGAFGRFAKGRWSRTSRPVVTSAAASSAEATSGMSAYKPRTLRRAPYLPFTFLT